MPEDAPVFFFGAMSPYSWITAERIEQVLPQARWQGLLIAAVFKAAGRTPWGFTERRGEGIADCEARAAQYGLGPIRWPDPWPTHDLLAARAMTYAESRGSLKPFALAAMRLAFLEGVDLAAPDAMLEAARRSGLDPQELTEGAASQAVKDELRRQTDEATALGVFGVPTVAVRGELFWGDDRLEAAAARALVPPA